MPLPLQLHPSLRCALLLLLLGLFGVTLRAADQLVWVEGEDTAERKVQVNGWYDGMIKRDALSGGNWVTNFGNADGEVTYKITIPADGTYHFWVRANPVAGAALAYQLGDGAWTELDMSKNVDVMNLAQDDKPDMRFIAWIRGGQVPLKAGPLTVRFRMHSGPSHHGAIDCFCFSTKSFTPSGKTKPGQKLGSQEPGWFAFEPDADAFPRNAALDLSNLNEPVAGMHGVLRAAGDQFLLGDGTPVRFWAANVPTGSLIGKEDDEIDYLAGRLAKEGFNMVRLHGLIADRNGPDPMAVDPKMVARYHQIVTIFAKHGIYCLCSTYYPLWVVLKPTDGIDGANLGQHPMKLLFFEPKFQAMYRAWMKATFTTPDPTTGKRLCDENNVGIVEICNEDNLFFWDFNRKTLGPGPTKTLETQFGTWLAKKYGSLEQARARWPSVQNPDDQPAEGRIGVFDAWSMTRAGMGSDPAMRARMLDQIDFLADTQHRFFADTTAFLKSECGVRCPITGSNWTTCDNGELGALDRWTYTAAGVIDKHGYFGGEHKGDWRAGFSVNAGDRYSDKCALSDPADVPITYYQIAGYPNIHTEIAWNKPNRFIADSDLLISTYAALQGVNGYFLFVTGDGNWANNGNGVWTLMMPGELGQSPAAALQYRRGDLMPGAVVVRHVSSVEDLLALRGGGFIEGKNADFSANQGPQAATNPADLTAFDPLSYFVGRVERSFDPKATPVAIDLSRFIDRTAKTVTSSTEQVHLDWGKSVLTVNAPRSQAVAGCLSSAGTVTLGDVTIASPMEYGAIQVIALDAQPLARAHRILVQAFSEEKMSGWKVNGNRIVDVGHPPILVRDIEGTVTFQQPVRGATILDANGLPIGTAHLEGHVLTLPTNALYVLITR